MAGFLMILVASLLVAGALFVVTAAIGINRLPDIYTRMHAASKAGTVGSGLLLLAAGLQAGDAAVFTRAVLGIAFFVLGAPVAAHLISRAAYRSGQRTGTLSVRDDLRRKAKDG